MKTPRLFNIFTNLLIACFTVSLSAYTMKPDFAYPKTTAENALKVIDSNAADADKVLAAIQYSIAESKISRERATKVLAVIDSLRQEIKTPCKEVLTCFEASIYSGIYNSDRWNYDDRKLPEGEEANNDIFAWDSAMFSKKIATLTEEAMADIASLAEYPISSILPLLQENDFPKDEYPTAASFILSKCIDLYNNSPQSTYRQQLKDSLLTAADTLIVIYRAKGDDAAYMRTVIMRASLLDEENRTAWLEECYDNISDSQWSQAILYELSANTYYLDATEKKEIYKTLQRSVIKFPKGKYCQNIREIIDNLSEPSISIDFKNQYLSGASFTINAEIENVNTFYVHLYRVNNDETSIEEKDVPTVAKYLKTYPVKVEGTIPFSTNDIKIEIDKLEYGNYCFIASTDSKPEKNYNKNGWRYINCFRISDLTAITTSDSNRGNTDRIYITSSLNLAPIENAKVVMTENSYRKKKPTTHSTVTNSEGFVNLAPESQTIHVAFGKDKLITSFYDYKNRNSEEKSFHASVLTDLSLYHPGDSIKFAVIAYSMEDRRMKAQPYKKLAAVLRDANYQGVDTIDLTTDEFGRCSGKMKIPQSGLLGNWSVDIIDIFDKLGNTYIQVEEYKAPTFFVGTEPLKNISEENDSITMRGRVMTYSGMPLADAEVTYEIEYGSPWFWRSDSETLLSGKCKTGANGYFEVTIPADKLDSKNRRFGIFTAKISAASISGETQSAPTVRFFLSKQYRINISAENTVNITDGSLKVNAQLTDQLGNPLQEPLTYSLIDADGNILKTGEFLAPLLTVDVSQLPSAEYTLKISMKKDTEVNSETKIILFRDNDTVPPVKTPLWLPCKRFTAEKGAKTVEIPVGTSFDDSYILVEVADVNGIRSCEWVNISNKITKISVEAPADNNRIWIKFVGCRNLDIRTEEVEIIPYEATQNLEVEVISMRDKITPGNEEKWTFRFNYDGKTCADIPVIATMSDYALNAIAPFKWWFNPAQSINFYNRTTLSPTYVGNESFSAYLWTMRNRKTFYPVAPQLNTYGYEKNIFGITVDICYSLAEPLIAECKTSTKLGLPGNAPRIFNSLAMTEDAGEAVVADEAEVTDKLDEQVEVREIGQPLAFFKPNMRTADDGILELSFTVPQSNTTWQLQLAAYLPDMNGVAESYRSIASKPVMASLNAPRFIRTGDEIALSAMLFNATDEATQISGRIEIFNPSTGEIIEKQKFDTLSVDASSSRKISMIYHAPADLSLVGIRAIATNGAFSDGEQTLIAILPSSSPVVESQTFVLGTDTKEKEIKLDKFGRNDVVTLQYCDNPVWFCVTALPDIMKPESSSIISLADGLFSNIMAEGLARKYPQIKTAIDYLKEALERGEDSTLVSNLEKNGDLKIFELTNTTWVNDAASESLRMQNLTSLFDKERCRKAIDEYTDELVKRQNRDGGWSWLPDMKSSVFITGSVLYRLAIIRQYGFDDSLRTFDEQIERAISYLDSDAYDYYKKNDKHISASTATIWLYTRSGFKTSESKDIKKLIDEGLAAIEKDWRNLDIYEKATAVIVLKRYGKTRTAADILESLRQFAVDTPNRGMYYDNIASYYSRPLITARVLEAFCEIAPEDPAISRLKMWLVLQQQVQDLGTNRRTAEVVASVLAGGADWTSEEQKSNITIGGKEIELTDADRYTGAITLPLDPTKVSGKKLKITKTGEQPAWGGVISQSIRPINEVKSHAIDGLSIVKEVYQLEAADNKIKATDGNYTVGSKVRVTLTIKNTDDMQYVAIADERGACFEPVDKISGYTSTDGVWYYQEQRNTKTDIFIDYLPKGTHVISYDCYLTQTGEFSVGIATLQSLYSPTLTAHSAGKELTVKPSETK